MNKKIITGFLMFALAVFSMSSFVACKDYDEDSYDDLKARINKQITITDAIQNQIAELEKKLNNIKSCTCDPSKYASQEEFEKALKRIADLEEAIKNIKSCTCEGGGGGDTTIYITNPYDDEWIKIKFSEIEDQLKILNTLNAWQIYIENRIDSIANAIYGWDTTIYNLNYKVDSILKWLEEIHGDTTIIGGGCDPDCKKKIAKAQETANDALYLAQQALLLAMENAGRLNDHETRISELEKLVKTFVTKDELKEEIKKLNDRIDDLLDKMVTGIILQGTESPVIGYFNTPLDVRSQILAAYYGEVSSSVEFPAKNSSADYVDASEFWTARNMEVIGSFSDKVNISGEFVSTKNGDTKGNAGKLYVTVNPAEVDFTGKVLALESSTGEAAGVELEPLAVSEKELSFGYTRAYNGFYEAEATLTDIEKAKIRLDFKQLEDQAKDMLKEKTKSSVLSFGAALMSSIKDVMPAYAAKATWTAPARTDAVGQKSYSVYSQYGLAAAAIKPFSYAFLKDLNVNLPGEAKLQEIADNLLDKISEKLNLNLPDFSKYDPSIIIKDIEIDPTNPNVTVTIQGTLKDENGNDVYILVTDGHYRYYMKDETDPWVYNIDLDQWQTAWNLVHSVSLKIEDVNLYNTIKYVADQINARYGSTSPLADLLNDVIAIGDLNATIQNAFDDVKSEVNGLITKAYNKLNSIFSKAPNKALQPVLIGKSGNKISLLSRSKSNPTKVSGSSLTLIPTSYTLELVAPAYKKYIVVSDVFNADGSEAAASLGKGANGENMAKVIDSEKTCTINGQSGYIYEISYNAVDYHGKIVNKRFYVQF
ncbi:MAG: hypothetical protein II866_13965 [Prevotella sp.]|nr:hypothetical protein [Prevotella sp.]